MGGEGSFADRPHFICAKNWKQHYGLVETSKGLNRPKLCLLTNIHNYKSLANSLKFRKKLTGCRKLLILYFQTNETNSRKGL